MKVIDLLNKLYNMEETPKKIKIGCSYLTLNQNKDNYIYEDSDEYYGNELIHWYDLDTKVEIIEEDKKLEKINWGSCADNLKEVNSNIDDLSNKINEIKDYFEDLEIFAPSRDIKYDILDIIEGSNKE